MAGHAAKKTAKRAESQSQMYMAIALASLALHVVVILGIYRDFSFWNLVRVAFLAGVSALCYKMIVGALELGVGPGYWLDLFIINTVVELLSLGSVYFWVVYLTVPGYGVYKLGGHILSWVFAGSRQPPMDEVRKGKTLKRG